MKPGSFTGQPGSLELGSKAHARGTKMKQKTFTITDIRLWEPCYDPARYLPEEWEGTVADILRKNEIPAHDRLWVVCRKGLISDKILRLFAVWCARQVEHLMTDKRSIRALDVAEAYANGVASAAARDAARDAASAASEAARAAQRAAASDAASDAASAAAWSAAWAAARAAIAASDSELDAASAAARAAQITKLIEMIEGAE